ncbi:MAG: S41 family peptidase [Acidobacteriota bacterium]
MPGTRTICWPPRIEKEHVALWSIHCRALLLLGLVGWFGACGDDGAGWRAVAPQGAVDKALEGVWAAPATGHIASFSEDGVEVFHILDDFCIRDTGVVPEYSLYRFDGSSDRLLLHYYDYRDRPELLQAPKAFRRVQDLPDACRREASNRSFSPGEVYALIVRSFDRFYAVFEPRGVDWDDVKRRYSARAEALSTEAELFELLEEMLTPLADGHTNVTWADRSFNAGRPRLRARLRDAWAESGSELSEGAFVSTWHRGVIESVGDVLDPGSRRSGAAEALEWGTIGDTVGYVRIHRFSRFTEDGSEPRSVQYEALETALDAMRRDLAPASRIIVDVAMNGGGSDAAAQLVASYFADRRRRALRYEVQGAPSSDIFISPRGQAEGRPVFLLTSEITASAAESFVLMMRAFPHVTHVGGRTRGGISSLLPKPFPNGFMVTFSYQRVLGADGVLYEGAGIPPQRSIELFPDGDLDGGFAKALAALAEAR